MAKPTERTDWATQGAGGGGASSALRTATDSSRWNFGWKALPDNNPTDEGEAPNLNQQNYWQYAVHKWKEYFETTTDTNITNISDNASNIANNVAGIANNTADIKQQGNQAIYQLVRSPWTSELLNTGVNNLETACLYYSPAHDLFIGWYQSSTNMCHSYQSDANGGSFLTGGNVSRTGINSVAENDDGSILVAVGDGGEVARSTDGLTWVAQTGVGSSNWTHVVWSGSKFMACGWDATTKLMESVDGITWTATGSQPALADEVTGLVYLPHVSRWVCAGQTTSGTNGIWISDDEGATWTSKDSLDSQWRHLAYSDTLGRLVAVSNNTSSFGVLYSDDNGDNWTQGVHRTAANQGQIGILTWCPAFQAFYAFDFDGYCHVSADGITFTQIPRQLSGYGDSRKRYLYSDRHRAFWMPNGFANGLHLRFQ